VFVGLTGLVMGSPVGTLTLPMSLGIHTMMYMGAATILGTQLIVFAVLTKWVAVMACLVPEPVWMTRWALSFKIENGLFIGLALLGGGLLWSLRLTLGWGRAGFGPLDPVETMRSVIPAATLMVLGMQAAMASFFAGAIHFGWRSAQER
jgi:hypothetical protein